MRIYTAHLRAHAPPVLVREGFSLGALVFGPVWLLARGVWTVGVVLPAIELLAPLFGGAGGWLLVAGLVLLGGWYGQDLVRWQLARNGFVLAHVVAARDADAAFARLIETRPDLIAAAAVVR